MVFWRSKKTKSRLTLHLGIHRTGTTGLQRNLAANRTQLAALGKCYPFADENHQSIAWAIHRGRMSGHELRRKLAAYNKFEHIILSAEDFCIHRKLDWIDVLKEDYDVEAVVYLRRQDHWLMSWYNQHVKWPFSRRHSTMTPAEFLACLDEFYWLDFSAMLGLWDEAVGGDRLRIRLLEKGQVEDTTADFLSLEGIPSTGWKQNDATQNDSLPVEMLEFARRSGMMDLKPGQRIQVIKYLQSVAAGFHQKGKTLYTARERQDVLDHFDASNRSAARRWLGRDRLFSEAPPDDRGLYVEGTLAANASFDALFDHTIAYLTEKTGQKRDTAASNTDNRQE